METAHMTGPAGATDMELSRSRWLTCTRVLTSATVALIVTVVSSGAESACFEDGIGCTNNHYIPKSQLNALSCDALWTVRNTIYDERGYCFRTSRAKDVFSNEDCHVDNAANIRFNKYERANIDRIVAVERLKGCR